MDEWNNMVRDTLISKRVQSGDDAGSWPPTGCLPWRREGSTSQAFSATLEVYYRHMPLYAMTQYGDAEAEQFPLD